ncbi:MAG: hypothetical protein EBU08_03755 [Micrococcales bacterium]|nr:hypothetical protein [Micrococcales bacterium]
MNGQRVNIYVDGWCEKNPGRGGWRVMAGGETVSERVMEKTTNNLCEYFAVIDAIRWVKKQPHNKLWTIWTDSTTAIAWLRNNKVKTSLTDDKSIDNDNFIVKKWHTKRLGEIPADFGRKKKTKRP